MLHIALWQLLRNKLLNGALVFASLVVVLLVVTPSAIKEAAIQKPQNYLRATGTDVFVLDPSAFDYASNSILTLEDLERVKAVEGVEDAIGTIFTFTNAEKGGQHLSVTLQSFEPGKPYGGPWKIVEGRNVQNNGEVVADESLKGDLGLRLGDALKIGQSEYGVVGFSGETSAIGKQMVFITTEDAMSKLFKAPVITHIQVSTVDSAGVTQRIRDLGLHAYGRDEFVAANDEYWEKQIAPTLDMVLSVAEGAGFALFLLLALVSVLSRRRMLGVYRALGASLPRLAGVEVVRSLSAATIGIVLGVLLSIPFTISVNQGSPGLDASVNTELVIVSAVTVLGALLVALIPSFIYIGRVPPATAIKEG